MHNSKSDTSQQQHANNNENPTKIRINLHRAQREVNQSQKRATKRAGEWQESTLTHTHTSKTPTSMPKSVSPLCSWGPALGAQMIRDGGQQRSDKERETKRESERQWNNSTSKCSRHKKEARNLYCTHIKFISLTCRHAKPGELIQISTINTRIHIHVHSHSPPTERIRVINKGLMNYNDDARLRC